MNTEDLFRETINANQNMIFRICCRFFGPGEDAKDACQEVLLKIWLNISGFRRESSIKTWIYRIAVNVCISFLQKNKQASKRFLPFTRAVYRMACSDSLFIDDENKLQFFNDFMKDLNLSDKALVSLYLEDIDTRQISEITGLSESNVRVRIHRIKSKIKEEWERKYGTR